MSNIKENVKRSYAAAIQKRTQIEQAAKGSCCAPSTTEVQTEVPTPSFGCVVSLASKAGIKPGDVVVDFGSGAGHDVFEAAEFVGPEGRVIGIDFTPDMINAALKTTAAKGFTNVDFRLSDIENISTLPDNFANVVISNCVINLSLDKEAVFREAFRILKPGGRLVDADIIAVTPLPSEITQNPEAWCACLGGALTKEGYSEKIEKAGFEEINITIFDTFDTLKNKFHSGIIEARKPE
ncbi:MAG: methyltransferase domain-containing protein [Candidatus Hodarchaeota archaeon]